MKKLIVLLLIACCTEGYSQDYRNTINIKPRVFSIESNITTVYPPKYTFDEIHVDRKDGTHAVKSLDVIPFIDKQTGKSCDSIIIITVTVEIAPNKYQNVEYPRYTGDNGISVDLYKPHLEKAIDTLTLEKVRELVPFKDNRDINLKGLDGLVYCWYMIELKDGKTPEQAALIALDKLGEELIKLTNR